MSGGAGFCASTVSPFPFLTRRDTHPFSVCQLSCMIFVNAQHFCGTMNFGKSILGVNSGSREGFNLGSPNLSRRWFHRFFVFTPTSGNDPI